MIQSVERALRLLESVARFGGEGAKLTEVSKSVGLLPSTAYRLLATLTRARYIRKDRAGHYTLGTAFHTLNLSSSANELVLFAQVYMTRLARQSGETINLAILSEIGIVFIRQIASQRLVRAVPPVGSEMPLHATAAGKAILAAMSPSVRAHYLEAIRYVPFTSRTIRSRRALEAELAQVQRVGYAVEEREMQSDGKCVAAAIRTPDAFPPAALSITAPAPRMPAAVTARLGRAVQSAAHAVSMELTKTYLRGVSERVEA